MLRILFVLLAAILSAAAWSASASAPTPKKLAKMSEEQLWAAVDKAAQDEQVYCTVAPFYAELARRNPVAGIDAGKAFFEGACALGNREYDRALERLSVAEGLFPVGADVEIRRTIDYMAMLAASGARDRSAFTEHVGHVATRDDPAEFAALNDEAWSWAFRFEPDEWTESAALVFARAASFDQLPEKTRWAVENKAIRPALQAGDIDLAVKLATTRPNPSNLVKLLIDRRYEAIWPQLESAAGSNLSMVLRRYLAEAVAQRAAAPRDPLKLYQLVLAKLWLGDFAGAVSDAAVIERTPKGLAKIVEDEAWTLDSAVNAYDGLGQPAEADAIFNGLADLNTEGRDWVVNFAINRANRLVRHGRWEEALPTTERAVVVAAQFGSPYAKEAAAADRYCAAVKLDPTRPELDTWWEAIAANFKDNLASAIMGAQCKGDNETARRFLRERLGDERTRSAAIKILQPSEVVLFYDERNRIADPRMLLDDDPALRQLFLSHGRDLPEHLWPHATRATSRKEITASQALAESN